MIAFMALLLLLQTPSELKQHVDAGLNAKHAGDLDTAIREFQRVVELAPGLAAAHVNLGAVYYEKKDYSHAIPSLRKASLFFSNPVCICISRFDPSMCPEVTFRRHLTKASERLALIISISNSLRPHRSEP